MTSMMLHEKLMQACISGNIEDAKYWLVEGADPNFNLKSPINALYSAIQTDDFEMISLLLENKAVVKEFVLQQAIEKDKKYLSLLVPNFRSCRDETLLLGVLQAAINMNDLELTQQAIEQGAKPQLLFTSGVLELDSQEILELLLENGFDIHADANKVLNHWMGGWRETRPTKIDLLSFISRYYLEKPQEIVKFKSTILNKLLLFRIGLDDNNIELMKFAVLIGVDKNEALNSALNRFYTKNESKKSKDIDYEIIEYILSSKIKFQKITISNAVFFKYTEVLEALESMDDLEYGYEISYKYENHDLCKYFTQRGVSYKAKNFVKMKISAIQGDINGLHQAIRDGADLKDLEIDSIIEVVNNNQVEVLKYFYNANLFFDISLNHCLHQAIAHHKAYESVSYLIELGFDITKVKKLPLEYRKRYPIISDMWEKRFRDIFEYTIYLATQIQASVDEKAKEEILARIAELSILPYVVKKSEERLLEHK